MAVYEGIGLTNDGLRTWIFGSSITNFWAFYKGVNLGCQTAGVNLTNELTTADIICLQKGSSPQDQVITGAQMTLSFSLAQPKIEVRSLLDNTATIDDAGNFYLSQRLFESAQLVNSGALLLVRATADGGVSLDPEDRLWLYNASPSVSGSILTSGNEQVSLDVSFLIRSQELNGYNNYTGSITSAIGYIEQEDMSDFPLPQALWPEIPDLYHDGSDVFLKYQNPVTLAGSGNCLICSGEPKAAFKQKAKLEIDASDATLVKASLSSGALPVNEKIFLFVNKGMFRHTNTVESAMAPMTTVPLRQTPAPVPVTGVTLDKSSASLTVGNTEQLAAEVQPDNAANKGVTWASLNPDIATVSSTGLVTAVADGSATIQVSTDDGNFTADCSITVATARAARSGGKSDAH